MLRRGLFPVCLAALLAGCPAPDDDDDAVLPPDDDDAADPCDEDTDCEFSSGLEICDDDGQCVQGDRNEGIATAQRLDWDEEAELVIAPAGDVDWFRIDAQQGDLIRVEAATFDEVALDPVVVYYDAAGTEIAFNDDFSRVSSIPPNARLYSGVPSSGAYYVSIQDRRSWVGDPGDPPEGGADSRYGLRISRLGSGAAAGEGLSVEPDDVPGDAGTWAVDEARINYTWSGFLQSGGDTDWIAVDLEEGEVLRLYGFPNGGSAGTIRATVFLPDGTSAVRSYDNLDWTDRIAWVPALETGPHLIEVSEAGGGGGWDTWYTIHAAKNPSDEGFLGESEPNDTAGQDCLDLDAGVGEFERWGAIHPVGDVDRYTFAAQAGDRFSVILARTDHGETTKLRVRVLDPAGDVFLTGDWDGGEDPVFLLQELDSTGSWQLELTEQDAEAGGAGRYYQLRMVQARG